MARLKGLGVVIASLLLLVPAALAAGPMPGAIFTTDVACNGTNVNIFSSKQDVYLDGGPAHEGAAGLPDGNYYVKVTEPGGTLLGTTVGAPVHVTGGEFDQCYKLWDILVKASDGTQGYDDSSNGEYKVWASQSASFPNNESKTDNFKVSTDGGGGGSQSAELTVEKFYDADADGVFDGGEALIEGWKVQIANGLTIDRFTTATVLLEPGSYSVSEYMPNEPNWVPTTANPVAVQLSAGEEETVRFGNVCLGEGGGHTIGFWRNKNGQSLIDGDDLAALVALNLRNADGSNYDPPSKEDLASWLQGANATNMAYMLSAQLAAMKLNVLNGFVSGSALIYAPGTTSANALGFATVNAIMAEADTELGLHGTAFSGDAWRSYQEALKNALDNANNNTSFVQPEPCAFTFEDAVVS